MATTEQLVTGVDFVPFSTKDLDASMDFYGNKLGLPRSVYVPERNYAEFETGNVTLSIVDGEAMGIGHNLNRTAMALHVDDVERRAQSSRAAASSSTARSSTPASATWRSSPIRTATR